MARRTYVNNDRTVWLSPAADTRERLGFPRRLPSAPALGRLAAGDLVKLDFLTRPRADGFTGELMWVRVNRNRGGELRGTLANGPFRLPLRFGRTVTFRPEHVLTVSRSVAVFR